jgi:hypothetical protein
MDFLSINQKENIKILFDIFGSELRIKKVFFKTHSQIMLIILIPAYMII